MKEIQTYHIVLKDSSDFDKVHKKLLQIKPNLIHCWEYFPEIITVLGNYDHHVEMSTWSELNSISVNSQIKLYSVFSEDLNQNSNWGLDRVSRVRNPLYYESVREFSGNGVDIYVLDTGIFYNHSELIGKSFPLYDCFRETTDPYYGWPGSPGFYNSTNNIVADDHGTHVATIAAGRANGQAPGSTLFGVRLFGNNGIFSTVANLLLSLTAVINNKQTRNKPSIINLSFGSSVREDDLWNPILSRLIQNGFIVVVAAGNAGYDCFDNSPAGNGATKNGYRVVETIDNYEVREWNLIINDSIKPITVGSISPAIDRQEIRSDFSNFGPLIDIFAPGENINSASFSIMTVPSSNDIGYTWENSYYDNSIMVIKSGTSMAAPQVSGVIATWLEQNPGLTHQIVRKQLLDIRSSKGTIFDSSLNVNFQDPDDEYVLWKVRSLSRVLYCWFTPITSTWITQQSELQLNMSTNETKTIQLEFQSLDRWNQSQQLTYELRMVNDTGTRLPTPNSIVVSDNMVWESYFEEPRYLGQVRIAIPMVGDFVTWSFKIRAYVGEPEDFRDYSEIFVYINIYPTPTIPEWITPAGELIGSPVRTGDQISQTFLADGAQPITYSLIGSNPSLIPGLDFSYNRLYGIVGPLDRTITRWEVLLRVKDGNNGIADRLFFYRSVVDNVAPIFKQTWLDRLSKPVAGKEIYEMATVRKFSVLSLTIDWFDANGDPVTWTVSPIPDSDLPPGGLQNGVLPIKVTINPDGKVAGLITDDAGIYYFTLTISDKYNGSNSKYFRIRVLPPIALTNVESDKIIWDTPAGSLGSIYESYVSYFQVRASNPSGRSVGYVLQNGVLPTGMTIDSTTGYILGNAPYIETDQTWFFTIRAFLPTSFLDRDFSIKVKSRFVGDSIMNFNAVAYGPDRVEMDAWKWATQLIPLERVFRPDDENWGLMKIPYMYVVGGVAPADEMAITNALRDYHKRTDFVINNVDWARMQDPDGTPVCDLIYFDVTDYETKAGGFDPLTGTEVPVELPWWTGDPRLKYIYPTSLNNIRRDIKSQYFRSPRFRVLPDGTIVEKQLWEPGLGTVGEAGVDEALPMWMQSEQVIGEPNTIPGYKPGLIMAYVEYGYGYQITVGLIESGINDYFAGRLLTIDRYFVTSVGPTPTVQITESNTTWDDGSSFIDDYTPVLFDNVVPKLERFFKFPPGDISTQEIYDNIGEYITVKNLTVPHINSFLVSTLTINNNLSVMYGTGDNSTYQLGLGDNTNRNEFTIIPGTDLARSSTSSTFSLFITKTDYVYATGDNTYGELGLGDTDPRTSLTSTCGGTSDWQFIYTGNSFAICVKKDGTLWSWGRNDYGQLGLGDTNNRSLPEEVGSDSDWTAGSANNYHAVALKSDGTMWAWGKNEVGQLGLGDTTDRNTPTKVGSDTDWLYVSCAADSTIALKSDGTMWSCGGNTDGVCGLGDTNQRLVFTKVGTDNDWGYVSAGSNQAVALKYDYSLYAWGNARIGTETPWYSPQRIGTDTDWQSVGCSVDNIYLIKNNGTLWDCGKNDVGQLGNGNFSSNDQLTITKVGNRTDWSTVEFCSTAESGVILAKSPNVNGLKIEPELIDENGNSIIPSWIQVDVLPGPLVDLNSARDGIGGSSPVYYNFLVRGNDLTFSNRTNYEVIAIYLEILYIDGSTYKFLYQSS